MTSIKETIATLFKDKTLTENTPAEVENKILI